MWCVALLLVLMLRFSQAGAEFDVFRNACLQKAQEAASNRVPTPQILVFKVNCTASTPKMHERLICCWLQEGSSESRWLTSRLVSFSEFTDWMKSEIL